MLEVRGGARLTRIIEMNLHKPMVLDAYAKTLKYLRSKP